MMLEGFFEKFDTFADAPGAVAKLRELVLHLAVRGKLVEPNDDDESVHAFLRRIWSDKSSSRSEYVDITRAKPFDLPPHWCWAVLAEVADFSIGKTPPRGESSYWDPADHAWVSIADMKHYGTITGTKEGISSIAAREVFRQRFAESGSILMSFKLTIGKIARAGIRCFHNEAIISLKPPEEHLADYLFRFLPIFAALQTSNNAVKGSTLNKGLLAMLPIALPPLAEQQRIVAKVDELMALCDRLEAQHQERETRHAALARASLARFADAPTPENLEYLFHPAYAIAPGELRKAVLTLAVRGKLVRQDPGDKTESNFLERLVSVTATKTKSSNPAGSHDSDALPFELPPSWSWVQAQDLCRPSSQITYGILKPIWVDIGVPTIRVTDLQNGAVVVAGIGQCSNERASKFDKTTLEAGDLLVAKDGATLGKTAFVPQSLAGANITQHVLRFSIDPHVDRRYVRLVIDSPHGQAWMRSETRGVALPGVNVGDFRRLPIPLPPLAEQRRIVAKVDQLLALVDTLKTQIASSNNPIVTLLDNLATNPRFEA